jgi:hypothetical protein
VQLKGATLEELFIAPLTAAQDLQESLLDVQAGSNSSIKLSAKYGPAMKELKAVANKELLCVSAASKHFPPLKPPVVCSV